MTAAHALTSSEAPLLELRRLTVHYGAVTALRGVDLSDNQLTELPESIFAGLHGLTVLYENLKLTIFIK